VSRGQRGGSPTAVNLSFLGKILERDLDLLIGTGQKVILAGDFIAKHVTWRLRQNNTALLQE
jgi:hypothetical protein